MKSSYKDFGLSGQEVEGVYDNFLCLGRKCKQRKKERHRARMARKSAKTDARNADTERVRAETQVIQQAASSPLNSPSPVITMPLTQQEIAPPIPMASSDSFEKTEDKITEDKANTVIVIVVGVLLLGGLLYQLSQKNRNSKKNQVAMKQKELALAA